MGLHASIASQAVNTTHPPCHGRPPHKLTKSHGRRACAAWAMNWTSTGSRWPSCSSRCRRPRPRRASEPPRAGRSPTGAAQHTPQQAPPPPRQRARRAALAAPAARAARTPPPPASSARSAPPPAARPPAAASAARRRCSRMPRTPCPGGAGGQRRPAAASRAARPWRCLPPPWPCASMSSRSSSVAAPQQGNLCSTQQCSRPAHPGRRQRTPSTPPAGRAPPPPGRPATQPLRHPAASALMAPAGTLPAEPSPVSLRPAAARAAGAPAASQQVVSRVASPA